MSSAGKLSLDLTGLTSVAIGDAGIDDVALEAISERAAAAVTKTAALRESGAVGFLDLPDDRELARQVMDFSRDLPAQIDTLVVLGIGGSSLGPHALYSALARPYDVLRSRMPGLPRRILFPDNPDPVSFAALLELCPIQNTLFAVVTKSGGTAETAAQLLVVIDHIERAVGRDKLGRHLVAITDPESGALRQVVRDFNLPSFPIPSSVGGRFSVLSAVGLLPAALAGLDVTGLLDGAARMRDRVMSTNLRDNPALMLAALLHMHHVDKGRPMVVVMPYVDALYDIADWFRQLWAESLGKELDVDGNRVNIGPTPIAARGATDQHSQLQLFAEGPADKVFVMVTARERGAEVVMPEGPLSDRSTYSYLTGRGMGELLDAELRGTLASLTRRGRPTALIELARVDAEAVGELFMLLEAATAFAGPLYGVDPYDQPGVEEAKRLAYAALGRSGYEDDASALESVAAPDPRYVFE